MALSSPVQPYIEITYRTFCLYYLCSACAQEHRPLSERKKIDVNKNNFDSVLGEFAPAVSLAVENTLAGDGREENIRLSFRRMKDFELEQVARQIPPLKAMLAMRNLLRDLKSNQRINASAPKGPSAPVALFYSQAASRAICSVFGSPTICCNALSLFR